MLKQSNLITVACCQMSCCLLSPANFQQACKISVEAMPDSGFSHFCLASVPRKLHQMGSKTKALSLRLTQYLLLVTCYFLLPQWLPSDFLKQTIE
ncbi:MAG: hypothetical protein F6K31_07005 [Symploca sp. SIO2G7]|nr:hypothetical protein [Symploca sp. SIO2G7]